MALDPGFEAVVSSRLVMGDCLAYLERCRGQRANGKRVGLNSSRTPAWQGAAPIWMLALISPAIVECLRPGLLQPLSM